MSQNQSSVSFNLSAGRADVPRLNGQVREAAQYGHEAIDLVIGTPTETLDYARRRSGC